MGSLTFLFKIVEGLVPAIPKKDYVQVARDGRNIKHIQNKNISQRRWSKNIKQKMIDILKFQMEDTLNNTRTQNSD